MTEFHFQYGGISAPSLEEAIDRYGRLLGFEVEKRSCIEAAKARAAI